jgi:arsenite-transporting ATPase
VPACHGRMRGPADLFARELLIFSGKGGVGKTTSSAAVAIRLAREGRRTLLVTVDPAKRLKDSLGIDIGHRVQQIRPNLSAMMLNPEKVVEEYLRENYPDANLTSHPFYKYLSNYMPGINEVLAIGKLIEFRREKDFDTIVIDTAPTGHALSFLTTPMKVRDLFRENQLLKWAVRGYSLYQKLSKGGRALGKILKGGKDLPEAPDVDFEDLFQKISKEIGGIQELLADHQRTTLCIVTLPERLPVEETIELHQYITKTLGIRVGYLIVNKVQPDVLQGLDDDHARLQQDASAVSALANVLTKHGYDPKLGAALVRAAEFNQIRRQMNLEYIADLSRRLPHVPQVQLPLHRQDIAGLERLELFEAEFFRSLDQVVAQKAAA